MGDVRRVEAERRNPHDGVAALAAHRSQYALRSALLPPSMLERLLGTERYVVAGTAAR